MTDRLIIGTRGSLLALTQTESVVANIRKIIPGIKINVVKIVTKGDRDRFTQLDKLDIAIFVKELEQALINKNIDIAVHSLKDVPTDLPAGLHIAAATAREDPRDALVAKTSLDKLPSGSRIGTGSLRRSIQLKRYRSDINIVSIRGNIDTRLRKFSSGDLDGVMIAAAALTRLGWQDRISEYLPPDKFLPEAGQGALAIESRSDDKEIADLISNINHITTWQSVMAERSFLKKLGGGCRAPIAALGQIDAGILTLDGMAASPDGKQVIQLSNKGKASSFEEIGIRLAERMAEMGAAKFVQGTV